MKASLQSNSYRRPMSSPSRPLTTLLEMMSCCCFQSLEVPSKMESEFMIFLVKGGGMRWLRKVKYSFIATVFSCSHACMNLNRDSVGSSCQNCSMRSAALSTLAMRYWYFLIKSDASLSTSMIFMVISSISFLIELISSLVWLMGTSKALIFS